MDLYRIVLLYGLLHGRPHIATGLNVHVVETGGDVLVRLGHDAADVGRRDRDEPHGDARRNEEEQQDEEVLASQHPAHDAATKHAATFTCATQTQETIYTLLPV